MFLKASSSRRIEWIDVARGLGIILVVYGHVLRGLNSAGILQKSNPFWASDYAIYTFHMPLFFLLAGLNVQRSMAKGRRAFLTSKLWTLVYPYILWSLLQGSIQLLIPAYVNAPRQPWALATILWRPIAQFWFLYALFLCHVIAWICSAKRAPLAIVAIVALFGIRFLPDSIWGATAYVFPFYVIGLFFSEPILKWRPDIKAASLWTAIAALFFAVFVHFGRTFSQGNSTAPPSFPAALAGILLTVSISHIIVDTAIALRKFFEFLGAASLTIYVMHVIVASAVRAGCRHLHLDWPGQLFLGTLIATLLPAALHIAFDRLGFLPILGLAPPNRARNRLAPVHATELGT